MSVRVDGNKHHNVSDNANHIINIFAHENQHYSDFRAMGFDAYNRMGSRERERRAFNAQMQHESWNKTNPGFRREIREVARPSGVTLR
jgi:hypothetical protein